MKRYKVFVEPDASIDIQEAIDYYDSKVPGLGRKFLLSVNAAIKAIQATPHFQVRYNNVRCLPVLRFPYMIHFTLDESNRIAIVRAVLHTSLNPDEYWLWE